MEPHRMLRRPKPPKMPVQVVTQVIARTENEKRQDTGEMSGLFAVVVVDDEAIDQAAHCPAHTEWAEDERPHDFVEEVLRASHDEDADGEEDYFCDERVEPEEEEGADVDGAPLLGGFLVIAGYDGLVGGCGGHGECYWYNVAFG